MRTVTIRPFFSGEDIIGAVHAELRGDDRHAFLSEATPLINKLPSLKKCAKKYVTLVELGYPVEGLKVIAQAHLDATAKARGYDNIIALCSYAASTVDQYKAEALSGAAWRDAVWQKTFEVMAAIEAGTHAWPTKEEFIAELPAIGW